MNETILGGKNELSIGPALIEARFLGDITPNYEEGVMEGSTQAGVRKQPSGMTETAELTFSVFVPSMDFLKQIFDVAEADPLVFGGGNLCTRTPRPINIHPICEADAKNDIHIYAGLVVTKFNPTLSTGDLLEVEVTVLAQPTADGYMLGGYPDPAVPQIWDVDTEDWVNVTP